MRAPSDSPAWTRCSTARWTRSRAASGSACASRGRWRRAATRVVLDEPTTYLDIAHEMEAFELLGRLAREGMAVLLVSHQLNLVARFADQLVLLHGGRVAASGTPDDVMRGEVLERVYGWPLVVTRDPAVGAPALVPLRRPSARGFTIHPPLPDRHESIRSGPRSAGRRPGHPGAARGAGARHRPRCSRSSPPPPVSPISAARRAGVGHRHFGRAAPRARDHHRRRRARGYGPAP